MGDNIKQRTPLLVAEVRKRCLIKQGAGGVGGEEGRKVLISRKGANLKRKACTILYQKEITKNPQTMQKFYHDLER